MDLNHMVEVEGGIGVAAVVSAIGGIIALGEAVEKAGYSVGRTVGREMSKDEYKKIKGPLLAGISVVFGWKAAAGFDDGFYSVK